MQDTYKWFKAITYGVIFLLFISFFSNQYIALQMMNSMVMPVAHGMQLTGDPNVDAQLLVFSEGVPDIYGEELGITYPDPRDAKYMNEMLEVLENYDRRQRKIILTGEDLNRYISLGTIPTIACEFCCSVKTLIHKNGSAACGCKHSAAMRGLMKYLILNHGDEFSDEEILNEVIKWKALTFPKQMMKRYVEQAESGKYTPDISALIVGTSMTKGAKKNAPSPLDMSNLPDMAGGC